MKNRFIRLISSLLIMAFLVSAMSVFSFAAEGSSSTGTNDDVLVVYNRGYEDGWEASNGGNFSGAASHKMELGKEATATGANYFLDMTTAATGVSGYYQINPTGTGYSEKTEFVLEFDVRSDGILTQSVSLLYVYIAGTSANANIIYKDGDTLYFTWGKQKVAITNDMSEWIHVTVCMVADYETGTLTATSYAEGPTVFEDFEPCTDSITRPLGESLAPQYFRFQVTPSIGI